MSKVWAGVVRVSHMGARRSGADDFHSERDQVAALERAVARLGGDLELLPAELGVSGGLPLADRPSLLAAVEGVEAGRYRGIVVAYQSRLARDTLEEELIHRRVEAVGGSVQFATGAVDGATIDGRLQRRLLGAFNAAERERHVERFADLREAATRAGIWQRRQTPAGYRRDPDTRRLVPDDRA
ncbi:recombinase family protein, partial [Paraconexibacter algicola]